MKTRRAINTPGHAHELTFSCYHRLPLLSKDRPRLWMIRAIERARAQHRFALLAYVIMPEHAHVLLLPSEKGYSMPQIMRSLKQPVARSALNWLRKNNPDHLTKLQGERSGTRRRHHFWQPGGGYDRNITEPKTLHQIVDYIHANPVRRELADKPTDWPWSSARWHVGLADAPIAMDPVSL